MVRLLDGGQSGCLPVHGVWIYPFNDESRIPPRPTKSGTSDSYYSVSKGASGIWVDLTAPFAARISGHQQVTDAFLLGLAIKENGVLVTFDKGIQYMASAEFSQNVLLLE
jgi:hypothetical protein